MRVLFISRPDVFLHRGGDTVHMEQTARFLSKLGVQVDFEAQASGAGQYDLIHFFNLNRPAPLLPYLKGKHPPLVVSSIYVDYRAADRVQSPWRSFLQKGLGPHAMEYLKEGARSLRKKHPAPPAKYWLEGHKAAVQEVLDHCSLLVTASAAEQQIIKEDYTYPGAYLVLPLGSEHIPPVVNSRARSGIVQVARLEPLKNQIKLIEAVKSLNLSLRIIGEAAPAHQSYEKRCRKLGGEQVRFLGSASVEEVGSALAHARVHALPSYYESTGLASIEALLCGCQIVVSDHPIQREIFGEHAFYGDPSSVESIAAALEKALSSTEEHQAWAKAHFRWEGAAGRLKEEYQKLLGL